MQVNTELVGFIITILGFAGTLWWRIEARHQQHDATARELGEKLHAAEKALLEHRVHAAETYQTRSAAKEQSTEVVLEVRAMRVDFKTNFEELEKRMREVEQAVAHNAPA